MYGIEHGDYMCEDEDVSPILKDLYLGGGEYVERERERERTFLCDGLWI